MMKWFNPLFSGKSKTILLIFYSLSSLLPILILVLMVYSYVLPELDPDNIENLKDIYHYGLLAMLLVTLPSFFLMSQLIKALESLTHDVKTKSAMLAEVKETITDDNRENEITTLLRYFNAIFKTTTDQQQEHDRLQALLSSLIAISSDVTRVLNFDQLFPLIVGRVTEAMSAERTSLYIVDQEKGELWTKVAEQVDQIRLPLGQGISGQVAQSGQMLNIADAWELPYFNRAFDEKNQFRTRGVLCAAIKDRSGETIGVLQVINRINKAAFDKDDEILFQCLTAQVGVALENSLLHEELFLSFNSSISTLSAVVDARHPLTAGHSLRVTEYAMMIANKMKLAPNEMEALRFAGMLHDIGKMGIADAVLLKNGPFTPEEKEEMNTHSIKTKMILDNFHFPRLLQRVPEIALYHHEKVNGQGYPSGLKGDQIPLESKIIAVADVFDALTSRRDYPKYTVSESLGCEAMSIPKAISILKDHAGTHFDPVIVDIFLQCLDKTVNIPEEHPVVFGKATASRD
jgi:putative nucleotidyltransferase with HDIG domain